MTAALQASLIDHAVRLVRRAGADALTMRALAQEAGCSPGLLYKLFRDRDALVAAVVDHQFRRLAADLGDFVARAGTGEVAGNLERFAEVLLGPAAQVIRLAAGTPVAARFAESAHDSGFVDALPRTVTEYIAAEKRLGRIDPSVDERAIGFLVTGAVHNLLVSGEAYPRPSPPEVGRLLGSLARLLEPRR
ncbi:hypothetical protein Sru01_30440 [Sphaerisporangium rufum]|uniref:HTH tetR-type domain-containing protein n=1 Tax=Sphaerisporangium rufum TaxID=1381558 RepID=A0A919R1Q0_9ACTN|nr:hypothetical protein Sru01_30440 [Sphaerisporangium rufum]